MIIVLIVHFGNTNIFFVGSIQKVTKNFCNPADSNTIYIFYAFLHSYPSCRQSCHYRPIIKNVSSSTSHKKRDFFYFFSCTLIYELISVKIDMNAYIMKKQFSLFHKAWPHWSLNLRSSFYIKLRFS